MNMVIDSINSATGSDTISLSLEKGRYDVKMYVSLSWEDGPCTISKKVLISPSFLEKMAKFLENNRDKVTSKKG